jgi:hypothetical protein
MSHLRGGILGAVIGVAVVLSSLLLRDPGEVGTRAERVPASNQGTAMSVPALDAGSSDGLEKALSRQGKALFRVALVQALVGKFDASMNTAQRIKATDERDACFVALAEMALPLIDLPPVPSEDSPFGQRTEAEMIQTIDRVIRLARALKDEDARVLYLTRAARARSVLAVKAPHGAAERLPTADGLLAEADRVATGIRPGPATTVGRSRFTWAWAGLVTGLFTSMGFLVTGLVTPLLTEVGKKVGEGFTQRCWHHIDAHRPTESSIAEEPERTAA